MKICGLITEYNPFHNGHIHHMQEAKKVSGCDTLVVVMSGNFVQRGTPAIIDKYERARMALAAGADLVIELPVLFSTSTAEVFATAAISLLHQLGSVESVCFGTEADDLPTLSKIADVLNNEPKRFQSDLKDAMRSGLSFPAARAEALEFYFGSEIENLPELMEKPNNILGIEYLRAMKRLNSHMTPYTIRRWSTEYHGEKAYGDVASATAIRKLLYEEDGAEKIAPFVPAYTAREFALKYGICTPIRSDDFSLILQYRLQSEKNRLTEFLDFSPELSDRVNNLLPDVYNFNEWVQVLKTKAYTHTRISRALLHLILNIREEDILPYKDEDYCMYAKLLGFRAESADIFSEIKTHSTLPLISKMADAKNILTPKALKLLNFDTDASNIYRNAVYQKFGTTLKDDYTAGIIKVSG